MNWLKWLSWLNWFVIIGCIYLIENLQDRITKIENEIPNFITTTTGKKPMEITDNLLVIDKLQDMHEELGKFLYKLTPAKLNLNKEMVQEYLSNIADNISEIQEELETLD